MDYKKRMQSKEKEIEKRERELKRKEEEIRDFWQKHEMKQEPQPGSAEHYELWKAGRKNKER